jgi:hypothetical protein
MRDQEPDITVLEALQPILLGPALEAFQKMSYRVSTYCDAFKSVRPSLMPGNAELFAFPSALSAASNGSRAGQQDCRQVLLKTSRPHWTAKWRPRRRRYISIQALFTQAAPFGGAPLTRDRSSRVDEHSLESLELTLDLLDSKEGPGSGTAGGGERARVAAIVMTMVGSSR